MVCVTSTVWAWTAPLWDRGLDPCPDQGVLPGFSHLNEILAGRVLVHPCMGVNTL